MPLVALFVLGTINFALHKSVLESGHPLLARVAWYVHAFGGHSGLMVEFAMLLGAMVMTAQGALGWAWGYAIYTAIDALCAWLILTRRI